MLYNFGINIIFRIAIILLLVTVSSSFVQGYVLTAVFVGAILAFWSKQPGLLCQPNQSRPTNFI